MKRVCLPGGESVPALGQGTWHMGERRDEAFIVSKVFPHNASRTGVATACERSLERLGTEWIDLYLLHWRGTASLADAVAGFRDLQRAGRIRHWGVSNLDAADMADLWQVPGGTGAAADQLLYHLGDRGIEWDVLPWLRAHRVPAMAYCPLGQGRLLRDRRLRDFGRRYGMTPAQAALAWLLANDDVIAIPKSGNAERVAENRAALDIELTAAQLAELDGLFPPPDGARPLSIV